MIFFLALIPATMLTMVGYAVIYLANRSEGGFKSFGKYLGFWAFTLAALLLLGAAICASHGGRMRHIHMMMQGHMDDMPAWQQPGPPWREPPPPAAPGAAPAPPPAPK
ncbi:MAG: hypothetical protein JSR15_12435 [Proteobacteria bacterium]|nr:hypothetical protein [Pseudomonadota bacterium]